MRQTTRHQLIWEDARELAGIKRNSIDLMVTSPPYPMIAMWDKVFANQNPEIKNKLDNSPNQAFELMHRELDKAWRNIYRVLKSGGIACINIGDATRTWRGRFALYPNHARIITAMQKLGFSLLPAILWRKATNAPNKFMGSGMMPPGAYVTLEHEYVLIFRKGDKREFPVNAAKQQRRQSAYFWEERNAWFSDVWFDLIGTRQALTSKEARNRSAAFPLELPYRLVSMFSVQGDTVLDPFAGIGTTMLAAMASGRHSLNFEIETDFQKMIDSHLDGLPKYANQRIRQRLSDHRAFVKAHYEKKGPFKHANQHYGFPVVTRQERELLFNAVAKVRSIAAGQYEVDYQAGPQAEFVQDWPGYFQADPKGASPPQAKPDRGRKPSAGKQLLLTDEEE